MAKGKKKADDKEGKASKTSKKQASAEKSEVSLNADDLANACEKVSPDDEIQESPSKRQKTNEATPKSGADVTMEEEGDDAPAKPDGEESKEESPSKTEKEGGGDEEMVDEDEEEDEPVADDDEDEAEGEVAAGHDGASGVRAKKVKEEKKPFTDAEAETTIASFMEKNNRPYSI